MPGRSARGVAAVETGEAGEEGDLRIAKGVIYIYICIYIHTHTHTHTYYIYIQVRI